MELCSISDSMIITYFKHDTLVIPSFCPTIIIWTAFTHSLYHHVWPDALRSIFEDPSTYKWTTASQSILRLKRQFWSLQSTWHEQCHHGTSHWSSTPQYPLWFWAYCHLHPIIFHSPIIPTNHYFLHVLWPQIPYHLGGDIMEVRREHTLSGWEMG